MEHVFLLLWLADVVGSVAFIGSVSVVAGAIAMVILAIFLFINEFEEDAQRGVKAAGKVLAWLAVPILVATLTPAPSTIRMLATAQAGKAAAATPLGDKAIEAINAVLDQVIQKAKR